MLSAHLFVVVGTPGSGKDLLIQAVNDMGLHHARIVPKHVSRTRFVDDGGEMICLGDVDYDLEGCDFRYKNYGDEYGFKAAPIWRGLIDRIPQVLVVSNLDALNSIKQTFGPAVKFVFVFSSLEPEQYRAEQVKLGKSKEYIENRVARYEDALQLYFENVILFDHVLLFAGVEEDLFDQIFRLFRFYEKGGD